MSLMLVGSKTEKVNSSCGKWQENFNEVLRQLKKCETLYGIDNAELKEWAFNELNKYTTEEIKGTRFQGFKSNWNKFVFTYIIKSELGVEWYDTYKDIIYEIEHGEKVSYCNKSELGKALLKLNYLDVRNIIPSELAIYFESKGINLGLKKDVRSLVTVLKIKDEKAYKRIANAFEQLNASETFMQKVKRQRRILYMDSMTHISNVEKPYRKEELSNALIHYIWKNVRDKYDTVEDKSFVINEDEQLFIRAFFDKKPELLVAKEDFNLINMVWLKKPFNEYSDNIKNVLLSCRIHNIADLLEYLYKNSRLKYSIETMERRALFSVKHDKIDIDNYDESFERFIFSIEEFIEPLGEHMHEFFKDIIKNAREKYELIHEHLHGKPNEFGEAYITEAKDGYIKEVTKRTVEELYSSSIISRVEAEVEKYSSFYDGIKGISQNLEYALKNGQSLKEQEIIRYAVSKSNKIALGLNCSQLNVVENAELLHFWENMQEININSISKGISKRMQSEYIRLYKIFKVFRECEAEANLGKFNEKFTYYDLKFIEDLSVIAECRVVSEELKEFRQFNKLLYESI